MLKNLKVNFLIKGHSSQEIFIIQINDIYIR